MDARQSAKKNIDDRFAIIAKEIGGYCDRLQDFSQQPESNEQRKEIASNLCTDLLKTCDAIKDAKADPEVRYKAVESVYGKFESAWNQIYKDSKKQVAYAESPHSARSFKSNLKSQMTKVVTFFKGDKRASQHIHDILSAYTGFTHPTLVIPGLAFIRDQIKLLKTPPPIPPRPGKKS